MPRSTEEGYGKTRRFRDAPKARLAHIEASSFPQLITVNASEEGAGMFKNLVGVIADCPDLRSEVRKLLSSADTAVREFQSLDMFLTRASIDRPGCVVMSLAASLLNQELPTEDNPVPLIVVVEHRDPLSACIGAIKSGAIDVLERPLQELSFYKAVETALAINQLSHARRSAMAELTSRYQRLTPRERQVLPLVTSGLLNKQIAGELGTSEITICVHRAQVMRKMEAHSLPELVRMVDQLGIQEYEVNPNDLANHCSRAPSSQFAPLWIGAQVQSNARQQKLARC